MRNVWIRTAVILVIIAAGCDDTNVDEAAADELAASNSDTVPVQFAADDDEFEAMVADNLRNHKTGLILSPASTLAATVKTEGGGEINFVINEGGVTIYEQRRLSDKSRLPDNAAGLGPVALYQLLAPTEKVPQALIDAEQNQGKTIDRLAEMEARGGLEDDMAIDDMEESESHSLDDTKTARLKEETGCDAEEFREQTCVNSGWHVCLTNRTGDYRITRNDKVDVSVAACPYRGTIVNRLRYRPWWTWHIKERQTLNAGWYGKISHTNWSTDFDIEARGYEADGDGYHHAVYWM